jgi:hypothetical protein
MKRFILEIKLDNEHMSCSSENDGFDPMELVGILEWKKNDIFKQIIGEIKPDMVSRKCIKDESEAPNEISSTI